ncbi:MULTISPECIES: tyrosine-type recombinase/integrase [Cyanophyceae]|uniref:tyrosine-type recombinase/integrase n=1 Tax=Cyanophyceae TaxID=3028117 RepID=UPI00168764E6|nr:MULTISPECIES: tyrosine-type recombinase/integrase [Cyanophyceae]MBD1918446.1 tyrosine-type recombinase/integrase [Phormidium sp. FACHB-77]MBD2031335.1 tyrosine-type recombinase/integrase [Phormidium sp. FACHB-322]MBD2049455.1 tyrosine-type recombinase/integrase [Leptolyngbya sp. FACHB-60]
MKTVITLAGVSVEFLQRPGLEKSTRRSYESALLPLLQEYGQMPIEIITRQTLQDYLSELPNLAYTTHQRHQATIQALFNFAVEQGYLKANPIARLKRRKPDRDKGEHGTDDVIRYLTPEQLKVLYQVVVPNLRMNALVHLLHRTGARIAEVLALDLEIMNLDQRKFQVVGKGNKRRWCFYSEDAARVLERYLKYERHSGCSALFTAQQPFTLEVSRMSYRTAYQDWTDLIAQSPELEGIRMHDLRHTFATERVGLMGIEELRALMGHQNIQTTLRYQKVTSQRAETVAQAALAALTQS